MNYFYHLILKNIILPFGDVITGSSISSNLKKLRNYDRMTKEELEKVQIFKLKKLLKYVTKKSVYYKNLKINEDSDPVIWLKKFPILEKKVMRENEKLILTCPSKQLIKTSSSGSTGERSFVYLSKEELSYIRANQINWWSWAGYKIGNKVLQTGIGTPTLINIKGIKNIIFRTNYVRAFSHNEKEILLTLRYIKNNKNLFVVGFPSSLYLFASLAKKNNIAKFNVRGIISLGGKLFNEYRDVIEEVFNSKINDTYGCGEGIGVACQKDLDYLYIITPNTFIEIVDDNGNHVKDGEMGHVLLTNLNAYSFPLIRYRIGDLASILPTEQYPQKRELNYPLLKEIIGRDTDIIKTASGKNLVVHSFTAIFKYLPSIKQFCVIQKEINSIDLEYIVDEGFNNKDLEFIQKKVDETLGEHLPINFKKVTFIPPTKSGKPQIIISMLN